MKSWFPFLAVSLLLLAGCASVPLPEEALSRVDRGIELIDIRENPEKFQGYTLLVGGKILENKASETGSTLEILEYRLDSAGRPVKVNEKGGRFLVRADRFLDPEVYEKGDFITLVGTVSGIQAEPLQEVEYRYPVLRLNSAHLWRETTLYGYPGYYSPYYYGPYYYDYYDPFWYRSPWYRDPWYYDRWGYRPWRW